MPIQILQSILMLIVGWASLLLTGRLFDLVSNETHATWKDDALASLTIVVVTGIVFAGCLILSYPPNITGLAYLGMIYFAFQLDGILYIITFWSAGVPTALYVDAGEDACAPKKTFCRIVFL